MCAYRSLPRLADDPTDERRGAGAGQEGDEPSVGNATPGESQEEEKGAAKEGQSVDGSLEK